MNTAFNNDPQFKAQLLSMAARHRELDEYAKGTYGRFVGGKLQACSIGCTVRDVCSIAGHNIETNDHAGLSELILGSKQLTFIPRLADVIFERLQDPLHTQWTERWLKAIPVGANVDQLTLALPRFLLRTLDRLPETDRLDVVASIKGVRDVLRYWVDTGTPDEAAAWAAAEEAARAAEAAAWAAAWAAWAAARAAARAAEAAARAAAWTAAEAAEEAAWTAARAAAWTAARAAARAAEAAAWAAAEEAAWAAEEAAWIDIADDFIECLAAAPQPGGSGNE